MATRVWQGIDHEVDIISPLCLKQWTFLSDLLQLTHDLQGVGSGKVGVSYSVNIL